MSEVNICLKSHSFYFISITPSITWPACSLCLFPQADSGQENGEILTLACMGHDSISKALPGFVLLSFY